VLVLGTPAVAAPITVNAGESVTFNFDLSGATPAPPYDHIDFQTGLDVLTLDPGELGQYTFWGGLNATGGNFGSLFHFVIAALHSQPAITDGVFSITLAMVTGSITVEPFVYGVQDVGLVYTAAVYPTLAAVPEPATLTLLGLALAGAGARRRRERKLS